MIKGTAIREIRFKSGHVIRKGETLIIEWPDVRNNPTKVNVMHANRMLPTPAITALGWIGKSFSQEELADAAMESVCETPSGTTVEPDGIDSAGVPSWLLIYGLI